MLGAQILLCANITGDVAFEPAEQSTIDYIETHKDDLAGEDRLLRLIWGATEGSGVPALEIRPQLPRRVAVHTIADRLSETQ